MRSLLVILGISLFFISCKKSKSSSATPPVTDSITGPSGVTKTNPQKVYVHYMAWFDDSLTSGTGNWGWHWTMNNQDPSVILSNGRREIASWFYPMIGPYASSDPDVINYHLLLIKYAGIDGIIVDWYGIHSVDDYPNIKRNTDSVFNHIAASGLQFGICYEDATLANDKAQAGIDTVTAAQQDFSYLQSAYFTSKNYITVNGNPLLLCFGPQGMMTPADWQSAFSVFTTPPFFLTLQDHQSIAGSSASGSFAWVESSNTTNLQTFYSANAPATSFGAAYPGFKDFYAQGDAGTTLFFLTYGNTLQNTLTLSQTNNAAYIQLITWNDYGEGTMIEPTLDYNFTSLQTIQQYTGVSYTVTELQLIYKWFTLRKKYVGNAAIEAQLTQAYAYLAALNLTQAHAILDPMS